MSVDENSLGSSFAPPPSWSKNKYKRWRVDQEANQKNQNKKLLTVLRARDIAFANEPKQSLQCAQLWKKWNDVLVHKNTPPRMQGIAVKNMNTLAQMQQRIENLVTHRRYVGRLLRLMLYFFAQYDWNQSMLGDHEWCVHAYEFLTANKQSLTLQLMTAMRRKLFGFVRTYGKYIMHPQPNSITNRCAVAETQPPMSLQDMFIWQLESEHMTLDYIHKDICERCKRPMILIKKQAMMSCKCSGIMVPYHNMTQSSSEYGKTNATNTSEYERLKFIITWLSQYRRGSKKIEPEIILKVKVKLMEMGYTSKHEIKMTTVKTVLKALGLKSYVKYHAKLANILNGVKHSEFTDEQYSELIARLNMVEQAFQRLKCDEKINRDNFPNLPFVVTQIIRINQWTEHLQTFRVQRVKNSLLKQMDDWQYFTEELRKIDKVHKWPCLPTN